MNTFATTNGEIGEMLTRSSAAMKAANNSLEETIALESAAVEITRNAETTGTAFRTISMRIRGYDENSEDGAEELSEELENISGDIYDLTKIDGKGGISIFTDKTRTEYKSTYEILKEISEIWDELTDKQQAQLLEKLGGKRGAQTIAGLLESFDEVERAMETMEDAAGSSDREMGIIRDSISYKLNAIKQEWVGTLTEIAGRDEIKDLLDDLLSISEGLGDVVNKFGLLQTAIVSFGTVYGARKLGLFNYDRQKGDRLGFLQGFNVNGLSFGDVGRNTNILKQGRNEAFLRDVQTFYNNDKLFEKQFPVLQERYKDVDKSLIEYIKNQKAAGVVTDNLAEGFKKQTSLGTALSSAIKGIGGSLLSMVGNMGVSLVASMAISAVIKTVNNLKNSYEDLANKALEVASEFSSSKKQIDDYTQKLSSLRATMEDSSSTTEEVKEATADLYTIQNDLIGQYGAYHENIDLVNGDLEVQLDLLREINKENSQKAFNEINANRSALSSAANVIANWSEWETYLGISSLGLPGLFTARNVEFDSKGSQIYNSIQNNDSFWAGLWEGIKRSLTESDLFGEDIGAKKYGSSADQIIKKYEDFNASLNATEDKGINKLIDSFSEFTIDGSFIKVSGSVDDVSTSIVKLQNQLTDLGYQNDELDRQLTEIYNDAQDIINSSGEAYNAIVYNEIQSNAWLRDYYNQLVDIYNNFKAAQEEGDTELVEKYRQEYVDLFSSIFDDPKVDAKYIDYFEDMYPELQSTISNWEFEAKILPEIDFSNSFTKKLGVEDFIRDTSQEELESLWQKYVVSGTTGSGMNDARFRELGLIVNKLNKAGYNIDGVEGLIKSLKNLDKYSDRFSSLKKLMGSNWKDIYRDDFTEQEIEISVELERESVINVEDRLSELEEGGTVDLNVRPEINTKDLEWAGWTNVGEGYATVFTNTYSNEEGTRYLNFTPIIVDPETGEYKGVLSPQQLQSYAEGVIAGTKDDYLHLQIGTEFDSEETAKAAAEEIHELHEYKAEGIVEFIPEKGYDEIKEELSERISPIEAKVDVTYSSGAVKELDALKDALSGLDEVFDTTVTYGAKATVDDLQSLIDGLDGVTFNFSDDELADANAMSNAIEAYTDALIKNGATSEDAQVAVDKLVTAYIDQSNILEDLEEDNTDYYISVLKSMGITNAEEVVMTRVGKAAKNTSTNLKALSKAVAQNRDIFEDGFEALQNGEETTTEFNNKIEELKDELAALFLVEESAITNDFIKEHFEDILLAIEGDIEALRRLRVEMGKTLSVEFGVEDDAILNAWDDVATMIDELDGTEFEINGSMDNSEIVEALNEIWNTGKYTIEEFEKLVKTYTGGSITLEMDNIEVPDIAQINKMGNTEGEVAKKEIPRRISYKYNGKSTGAAVSDYKGVDDDDSDSSSDSDSDSSDFSESFDWIEKAINRLEEELDRLDEQVGNTYKNWTSRNEALLEEITKTGDEIKMQADASKKYEELANEVAIPEEYKIKVQAGEMSVEDIDESVVTEALKDYYNDKLDKGELDQEWQDKYKTNKLTDEDYATLAGIDKDDLTDAIKDYWNDQLSKGNGTAEMLAKYNTNTLTDSDYAEMLSTYIQDYEDLYDKSVEATDKETELTKTVLDYHKQIFEDIQTQLDEIVSEVENKVDLIDKRMTRSEEMGYFVNTDYYDQLIDLTQERIDARSYQIEQATQAMNQAVENGMEKYSEEWYEMYNNILEMVGDQEEDVTQKIKYENEKRQQLWDRADWIEERMNDYVDEAEFIRGLLDGEKLFEDDGQFTKYGVTNLALLSSEYQANVAEAERYRSQYEALQEDLKKSPGDKNLIERLETIKKGWQDATSAVQDNEKAIQEALKASVDQYLSNLQEIINKYKEALQSSKDLYDWQKNVSDQTTNIANLEKQINAYANDDSEEARKTRQELQKQLDEAQQNLEESQWEHYISETGNMLDDMYDKLSDYLEEQTEDMHVIRTLMEEYVNNHETEATEGLTAIESIYNVTSDYFDHVDDGDANTSILTDIKTTLNNIYEGWKFVANPEENGNTNEVEYESSQVVVNDDGTVSISRLNGNAPTGATEKKGTWKSDDNGYWFEYEDGSYAKNEWKKIDDQDYYFDEDGYMATSQYVDGKSIRPDGTVEDDDYEWKESDGKWWYGSSSENYATGHVKIDGQWHTFDDEGWWLGAYAKGSKSISKTGIGITNEDGSELVWRTDSGALLTPLNQGDMVFTSDMSRRLWEIAKGNIPSGMNITMPSINGSSPQNVTANNQISIELPNVKNYDEFKKAMKNDSEMEKFWQEITVGQMMGNNTLKKNKY